jgi:hypothetical protein
MAVRNVDDHGPESGRRDLDGHLRCDICGYRWPCPDVRAAGASFTPNEIALLELVEPGWSVYERIPGDANHAPRGGVVLGWEEDPDTEERIFTCLDWKNGKPYQLKLRSSQIDPGISSLPNATSIRNTYRRLAAEVARSKGTADTFEVLNLEIAFTLARSIA